MVQHVRSSTRMMGWQMSACGRYVGKSGRSADNPKPVVSPETGARTEHFQGCAVRARLGGSTRRLHLSSLSLRSHFGESRPHCGLKLSQSRSRSTHPGTLIAVFPGSLLDSDCAASAAPACIVAATALYTLIHAARISGVKASPKPLFNAHKRTFPKIS